MLAPAGGRVLFVAGQIGVEAGDDEAEAAAESVSGAAESVSPRVLAKQFGVALARVAQVVEAAGGQVTDIGRLTIYVTEIESYRRGLAEVGAAYRSALGKHFPAMALVAVTELVDPRAVVEVEATAVIPQARPNPRPAIDPP